jgi:hypothetical protein
MTIIGNCVRPTVSASIPAISIRPNRTTISDRFAPTRDSGATPTRSSDDGLDRALTPSAFAEAGRLLAENIAAETVNPYAERSAGRRRASMAYRLPAVTPAQGSVENSIKFRFGMGLFLMPSFSDDAASSASSVSFQQQVSTVLTIPWNVPSGTIEELGREV